MARDPPDVSRGSPLAYDLGQSYREGRLALARPWGVAEDSLHSRLGIGENRVVGPLLPPLGDQLDPPREGRELRVEGPSNGMPSQSILPPSVWPGVISPRRGVCGFSPYSFLYQACLPC